MFLNRILSDFGIFVAFIAIITGISIGLIYIFPERKFLIRKWLHIFSVGITAFVTFILSVIVNDLISENQVFEGLQLLDDFLLLILAINILLWIAVFGGFFKINGRKSWGIAWFPTSFFILIYAIRFFSPEKNIGAGLYYTATVFFILAIADGFAALVGYKINPIKKTRVGSIVFYCITFIILCLSILYAPYYKVLNAFHMDERNMLIFSFFGALLLSTVEYYSKNGIDNLTVPILGMFYLLCFPILPIWTTTSELSGLSFLGIILIITFLIFLIYKAKWLNESGIVMALILAFILWVSELPFLPILSFFVLGSLAGKLTKKQNYNFDNDQTDEISSILSTDKKHGKPRDAIQVLANGGIPLLIGVFLVCMNSNFFSELELFNRFSKPISADHGIWLLVYWSVMSAALADTWSSELGMRFGKNPIDIMGFRRLSSGASGGITWAGTLFGCLGSVIIGFLFLISRDGNSLTIQASSQEWNWFITISVSGLVGTLLDSILGSLFQKKKRIHNELFADDEESGYTWRYWSNDMVNWISLILVSMGIFCVIR